MESQVEAAFTHAPLTNLVCSVNASSMFLDFWSSANLVCLLILDSFTVTRILTGTTSLWFIMAMWDGFYCFWWFIMKWRTFSPQPLSLIGNEYKFLSSSNTIESINVGKIFFVMISSSGLSYLVACGIVAMQYILLLFLLLSLFTVGTT